MYPALPIPPRVGRLTVIRRVQVAIGRYVRTRYVCKCDCGNEILARPRRLYDRVTKSCGCLRTEELIERNKGQKQREAAAAGNRTHGRSHTVEYELYCAMLTRCRRKSGISYPNYGGRGIKVADRWIGEHGFENWIADVGERPSPEHSLERIDNNGNYEPGNVKWATKKEQMRNTRRNHMITLDDVTQCITAWAETLNVKAAAIHYLIKKGFPDTEALRMLIKKTQKDIV